MTSSQYLIKGASILGVDSSDLLISNGVIAQIAPTINDDAATIIEAKGSIILPGLVDLHTHVREPGREDSETVLTASRSGAKGGFTALSAMANTSPVADTAGVVEQVFRLGQEAGLLDVFPIGAVTHALEGKDRKSVV